MVTACNHNQKQTCGPYPSLLGHNTTATRDWTDCHLSKLLGSPGRRILKGNPWGSSHHVLQRTTPKLAELRRWPHRWERTRPLPSARHVTSRRGYLPCRNREGAHDCVMLSVSERRLGKETDCWWTQWKQGNIELLKQRPGWYWEVCQRVQTVKGNFQDTKGGWREQPEVRTLCLELWALPSTTGDFGQVSFSRKPLWLTPL